MQKITYFLWSLLKLIIEKIPNKFGARLDKDILICSNLSHAKEKQVYKSFKGFWGQI